MKVFVDTNVLVSAIAARGLCADVVREVLASHDLVVSEQVLNEVGRVLRAKLGAGADPVADYVRLLRQGSVMARPGRVPAVEIRDREDLPILAAATAARAEVFVTGDRELLELGAVEGVEILSPRQFWERLRSRKPRRAGE